MMQSRRWHFAFRDGHETLGAQRGLGVFHELRTLMCETILTRKGGQKRVRVGATLGGRRGGR